MYAQQDLLIPVLGDVLTNGFAVISAYMDTVNGNNVSDASPEHAVYREVLARKVAWNTTNHLKYAQVSIVEREYWQDSVHQDCNGRCDVTVQYLDPSERTGTEIVRRDGNINHSLCSSCVLQANHVLAFADGLVVHRTPAHPFRTGSMVSDGSIFRVPPGAIDPRGRRFIFGCVAGSPKQRSDTCRVHG